MNLQRKCLTCGDFFPVEPLEFKFYCEKESCQKKVFYRITHIKRSRHIPLKYFDIYDLERPIIHQVVDKVSNIVVDKVFGYERVCRVCGNPLLKKDGSYSYHKRYCNEHTGDEIWAKYNWGPVSKNYAWNVAAKNKTIICKLFREYVKTNHSYYKENPERIKNDLNHLTICELCSKLCLTYEYYWTKRRGFEVIKIHHKIPVHTLDKDNLHLIWDESNLIALCEYCHHKQDHQLKTKVDPFIHFRKITEFIDGV